MNSSGNTEGVDIERSADEIRQAGESKEKSR
jgi:hypothetical protein